MQKSAVFNILAVFRCLSSRSTGLLFAINTGQRAPYCLIYHLCLLHTVLIVLSLSSGCTFCVFDFPMHTHSSTRRYSLPAGLVPVWTLFTHWAQHSFPQRHKHAKWFVRAGTHPRAYFQNRLAPEKTQARMNTFTRSKFSQMKKRSQSCSGK